MNGVGVGVADLSWNESRKGSEYEFHFIIKILESKGNKIPSQ